MDDIFDAPQTDGSCVGERSFDSVLQARDWLERRGWHEKCGGGYWRGGEGSAYVFSIRTAPSRLKTVVCIESV